MHLARLDLAQQASRPLQAMTTAGFPDCNEVFDFGWTGRYTIRMKIVPGGAAKPLEASFVHNHVI